MSIHKFKMNGVFASELESTIFGDDDIITYKNTEAKLQEANGKDIEVDFSSVGGLVDVGVDIFFMFRDYKRQYPSAQMQLNIKSQAASMASMFASGEFWDLVTVEDISSYMIHNPSMIVAGDYKNLFESAEYLKRLATLYAGVYAKRSNKSNKEIKIMMDKTTYLFGDEIVKNGFADEILKTNENKNKDSNIAQMQLKYNTVMEKLQQLKTQNNDYKKAAAKLNTEMQTITDKDQKILQKQKDNQGKMQNSAIGGENNTQEDVIMNMTELKAQHPDIHAETMQAGRDVERTFMIENNKAIMELKNKQEYKNLEFVQQRCEEALMNGENVQDLKMAIMALLIDPKNQAAIESPGDINSGNSATMSGEQQNNLTENQIAEKEEENNEW